jgi:hypothetical protein
MSINDDEMIINSYEGELLNLPNTIKTLIIEYSDINIIIYPPELESLYIVGSKIKLNDLPESLNLLSIVKYDDTIDIYHNKLQELYLIEIIDVGIINCPSLKKISLESYDDYCDNILNNLSNSVEIIELNGDFIKLNNLPSNLKIFRLEENNDHNGIIYFPISIKEIDLNDEVQILNISNCINLKKFKYNFCNYTLFNELPDSVEELILDNSYLPKMMNAIIPKNLKYFSYNHTIYYMSLYHNCNHNLNNILDNVKILDVGPNYNQPLNLPDNINELRINSNYNHFESIVDSNLHSLVINNYTNDTNTKNIIFPKKLIKLDIDINFNFELLPNTIEELIIRDMQSFIFIPKIIKPNLKNITFINMLHGYVDNHFYNINIIDSIDFYKINNKKRTR